MNELIDADVLFQTLLESAGVPDAEIAADLDIDTFDHLPFVTHQSTIAQGGNGPGVWSAVVTINVFLEVNTTNFQTIKALYAAIWSWDLPDEGIVPEVGAVESVDRDLEAFTRRGAAVDMDRKSVTQYTGSFELTIRNRPI